MRTAFALAAPLAILAAAIFPALADDPAHADASAPEQPYHEAVLEDDPIAYWRLNEKADPPAVRNHLGNEQLDGEPHGFVQFEAEGPRPGPDGSGHTAFSPDSTAAAFDGQGSYVAIEHQDDLAFDHGDTITLEAWVNPDEFRNNGNVYIIGKGRTHREGFPRDNQNWSLRLHGQGGTWRLSFLFRSADKADQPHRDEWHRWTSDTGVEPAGGWQHIAVSYTFGEPGSIRGYVNGQPVGGAWDIGGETTSAPVVDDDQVWIGSAMGASGGNSFRGAIAEVAVYRHGLSAYRIADRYGYVPPPDVAAAPAPDDAVQVEILEGVPTRIWDFPRPAPTETYTQPVMAFVDAPRKYNEQGLIIDRSAPYMLRANTRLRLSPGEYRLLLRSLNGAKLYLDGEQIARTDFNALGGHAHNPVEELPDTVVDHMPDIRQIPAAHSEQFVTFTSDGEEHVFKLEAFIGGPRQRFDVGELLVAIAEPDGPFHLLTPQTDQPIALTDREWRAYAAEHREHIRAVNFESRAAASENEAAYWAARHEAIRDDLADAPLPDPPEVDDSEAVFNAIDRYVKARLAEEGVQPAPLADDESFLRRVTLDTVGTVPTPHEIEQFFNDPPETRRQRAIDRLLDDPRWADHWVGYWQDVLAENPALINEALNNTGAFRWYLYEAMLDNRPIDRFATEMAMMEGSRDYGGPAGFGVATQNDVPMAEKAHTLSQAFLGKNVSCARCHDAPFRAFKQEDVFAMAAMLNRGAKRVPESSSVPGTEAELRRMIVEVTLEPGTSVEPGWPFAHILDADPEDLPEQIVRNPNDTRARAAALLTWHRNQRFAPVMANRVWRRYLGFGIVEPVDDWFDADASHPDLLAYLARQFKLSGYDLKHLARRIFNSHTYQRAIVGEKAEPLDQFTHLFASPVRRRMAAEQVVDSLFDIADKDFRSEPITMDPHSRRPVTSSNHLGTPHRAWQMATLANERDRPSLNLPMAQKINEVLEAFGWRGNRPDPLTVREPMPTVQQPAVLANGVVSRRITGLSDDSAFTDMALAASEPEQFVRRVFRRILTREPTDDELAMFTDMVADGFDGRIVRNPEPREHVPERRHKVTWTNHLSPEANAIRLETEREISQGDPPSNRLDPEWRQRAEDLVWTLINTPEFVMIP